MPQVTEGTLIRQLRNDIRVRSIRGGSHRSRNDSSTEWPTEWRHRELYRKASAREEHHPSPPSCQLSRCKSYLARSTICSESDLEPVHVQRVRCIAIRDIVMRTENVSKHRNDKAHFILANWSELPASARRFRSAPTGAG